MRRLYAFLNETHNTLFMVICLVISIFVFGLITTCVFRTNAPKPAQEIHITEDILTLQMNPSVLMSALKERGSDWCSVKRKVPVFGDITISCKKGGEELFNRIFLTDSVAPAMAHEYPHLFQYEEDGNSRKFTMSASRKSVTVPVWLVKTLIENDILQLPREGAENM